MAGKRVKPTNRFISQLCRAHNCKSIMELAARTGVPYPRLLGYANNDGRNAILAAAKDTADRLGVPVEAFIVGLQEGCPKIVQSQKEAS